MIAQREKNKIRFLLSHLVPPSDVRPMDFPPDCASTIQSGIATETGPFTRARKIGQRPIRRLGLGSAHKKQIMKQEDKPW